MITNRFDIPKPVRDLIDVAIKHNIVDGTDLFCAAAEFGDDLDRLCLWICEIAFTQRHHNGEGNTAVCKAVEAAHQALRNG